ncbi:3-keto-5-aminohexanoate cleavage protein [Labrenzia sp. DG1229]|uniref:3-keto-5-aminohexanoate cleavage protein n=1 Tax=Labrenzia sp. DG1229 TaxID=681847 RepID=UPI00048F3A39|nr:3-keto-5-aminohexanoate cleavage protein [Labrenzia sp. DG1229]
MIELPKILVAPNGARRDKSAHPALPMSVEELVETCRQCAAAGAGGVHAHVRNDAGLHSLDAGRYREVIARIAEELPGWFVQITSETAGLFDARDQQELIRMMRPRSISVAIREFVPNEEILPEARRTYHWARDHNVAIQHICYSEAELNQLIGFIDDGTVPGTAHQVQLVLGSYDGGRSSRPEDIEALIKPMRDLEEQQSFDWMLCAFGPEETDCLLRALELGGKARIGFENSLWNRDGSLAKDNAERVSEIVRLAGRSSLL